MAKKIKIGESENGKVCAVLTYFLVGIIWFFVDEKMKRNKYVEFHVKQAIVLLAGWVIISIISSMLIFFVWFLMPLISLAFFVLWVIGIVYALTDKKQEIPLIGALAKHIKF